MAARAAFIFALILYTFSVISAPTYGYAASSTLLTPEENLWLESRNNTIVVYPEKNNAPYSYQTASGSVQGLSVEYIELIAEKVGAKIQYLIPRSRSQILLDVAEGKGDVILSLSSSPEREDKLFFTESYVTVPVVIVVRKDSKLGNALTLADFIGKRVAMVEGSAIQEYIRQNFPRIVREGVSDDEAGLQQVVLGEAEAAVMDVASLSYLLSKQVLNSVRVAGSTGYDSHPAFAVPRDKEILQSIIEKGLLQISTAERKALAEKWVVLPGEETVQKTIFQQLTSSEGITLLYVFFGVIIVALLVALVLRWGGGAPKVSRFNSIQDLQGEIAHLEGANKALGEELQHVRMLEHELQQKMAETKG